MVAATSNASLPTSPLDRASWLDQADRCDIERDIERKLKKYEGNVRATLGAVAGADVRDAIRAVDHIDVRRTLNDLPPHAGHVLVETLVRSNEQRSRYTLSRLYAEGGLGKVWLARDGDLNREVALKEIRPDQAQHPEMWRRFMKEAQITGQLEHPNIVPVYELAHRREDDPTASYTMRFVPEVMPMRQGDLRLSRRKRSEGRRSARGNAGCFSAFIGVCQAIAYAHSRGVVHLDLKPDNVVPSGLWQRSLCSTGAWPRLLRLSRPKRLESAVVGLTRPRRMPTRPHAAGQQLAARPRMAPEQAAGRLELVDGRTDVYGLGAILYEILTGHPPHDGKNSLELFESIVNGETPRARRIEPATPKGLEAICFRAMAKERSDRFETAALLAEDMQRWLADEPVSSYREPALHGALRLFRRHLAGCSQEAWRHLVLIVAAAAGGFYLEGGSAGPGAPVSVSVASTSIEAARTQPEILTDLGAGGTGARPGHRASPREPAAFRYSRPRLKRTAGRCTTWWSFTGSPMTPSTLRY